MILPRPILDDMVAHAKREQPSECCGLLAGNNGVVAEGYRVENLSSGHPIIAELQVPPDRRLRYVMDPKRQLQIFKHIRAAGMQLVGIYHSHPHSEAYPSSTDVRLAVYPDACYLIISLMGSEPKVRAFRIHNKTVTEEPIQIS